MIIAAVEAGHDPSGFMRVVFKGIWEAQKNYAEEAELLAAADAAGLPGADLLAAAKSDAIQALYDANTKGFLESGGFGAPSYVVNGEIFWSQDRIDLLEDAVSSGRQPFAATG